MRRRVVVCLTLMVFGIAAPAVAKGPESVTIEMIDGQVVHVDFTTEYRTDNRDLVARLLEVSRIWYGGGEKLEHVPPELGPVTRLIWVNAGPPDKTVVERAIRQDLYLDAPGGPIINTPPQVSTDGWGSSVLGWARVDDSIALTIAEVVDTVGGETDSSSAPVMAAFGVSLTVLTFLVARRRFAANSH